MSVNMRAWCAFPGACSKSCFQRPSRAAAAATTILDGVKADRWRILVGDDAHRLDDLVRRSPEQAYDVDFFARPAGITARGAGGER